MGQHKYTSTDHPGRVESSARGFEHTTVMCRQQDHGKMTWIVVKISLEAGIQDTGVGIQVEYRVMTSQLNAASGKGDTKANILKIK